MIAGDKRVIFAGGKGGVGKTTVAAALALRLAERERVLLVSTDPAHSLGDLFGTEVGGEPTQVTEGTWAVEVDPEAQTDRYLEDVKRTMREFVRPEMYATVDRHMEMARLSPGVVEAATLDRISELLVEVGAGEAPAGGDEYDRLIFDTAPTGHTLRLLSLPETMSAWMDGLLESRDRSEAFGRALRGMEPGDDEVEGEHREPSGEGGPESERARRIREVLDARRTRFRRARAVLTDSGRCGFIIVVNADDLSVREGLEIRATLERLEMPLLAVVVNRVLPEDADGPFLRSRRCQQERHLERIGEVFAGVPRVRVPLLAVDVEGVEQLRAIAERLDQGAASA